MPRFINQHGEDIFVSDGPVTRGSFIRAMYEYDKSLKYAARGDVNEIKERVGRLEKGQAPVDLNKLVLDMQQKMPSMLDKSLNSSKVFSDFRLEVEKKGPGTEAAAENRKFSDDLSALSVRLEKLEAVAAVPQQKQPGEKVSKSNDVNEINELKARLDRLEKAKTPSYDISKITRDIQPLMPSVLDNTLNSSKVFIELKNEVGKNAGAEKLNLENKNLSGKIDGLTQRIEKLETAKASPAGKPEQVYSNKGLAELSARVSKLEKEKIGQSAPKTSEEGIGDLTKRVGRTELVLNQLQNSRETDRIEKRVKQLEKQFGEKAPGNQDKDIAKLSEKLSLISEENKAMKERIAKLEGKPVSPNESVSRPAVNQPGEFADLSKRLEKVERQVSEYRDFDKQLASLEEKISSVERLSSLGNVSSNEELSELKKRVGEIERTLSQKQQ